MPAVPDEIADVEKPEADEPAEEVPPPLLPLPALTAVDEVPEVLERIAVPLAPGTPVEEATAPETEDTGAPPPPEIEDAPPEPPRVEEAPLVAPPDPLVVVEVEVEA